MCQLTNPIPLFLHQFNVQRIVHQAEPEGLPTEVKGDSLLLLGTLLCGLRISCMGPTPEV